MMWDAVVVGAGAAGTSAALVLGRSRRRTLLLDAGAPRNAPAAAAHNVFTRDGTPPAELLRIARAQLAPYDGVEHRPVAAHHVTRTPYGFVVGDASGDVHNTRRLILASGVEDLLPDIDGIDRFWGRSVLHCPYCHGWEVRDRRLVVLANGQTARELVALLRAWSHDLVVCTNGASALDDETRDACTRFGITVHEGHVVGMHGGESLEAVVFADGSTIRCEAIFLRPPQRLRGDLAQQAGCALTESGHVQVDARWETTVPGVYAAGDMATAGQQVVIAAASGTAAGIAVNHSLVAEEFAAGSAP